jgi:predicted transcriptional regulator
MEHTSGRFKDIDISIQDIAAFVRRRPATVDQIEEELGYSKQEILTALKWDDGDRLRMRGREVEAVRPRRSADWKTGGAVGIALVGKDAFKAIDSGMAHLEAAVDLFEAASDHLGSEAQFRGEYKDTEKLHDQTERMVRDTAKIRMALWKYR